MRCVALGAAQALSNVEIFSLLRMRRLAGAGARTERALNAKAARVSSRTLSRDVEVAMAKASVREAMRQQERAAAARPPSPPRPAPPSGPPSHAASFRRQSRAVVDERPRRQWAAQQIQRHYRGRVTALRTELLDRPLAEPKRPLLSLRPSVMTLTRLLHTAQQKMILSGQAQSTKQRAAAGGAGLLPPRLSFMRQTSSVLELFLNNPTLTG